MITLVYSCSEEASGDINVNTEIADHQSKFLNGNRDPQNFCDSLVNTTGCETIYLTDTIYINGCAIWFGASVSLCPTDIYIYDVAHAYANSAPCNTLLASLDAHGNYGTKNIYIEVSKKVQDYVMGYINDIPTKRSKYLCNGASPCEPTHYAVNYIESGCYYRCESTVYGLPGQGNTIVIEQVHCGDSCCKRKTAFCYEADGSICYGTVIKEQISSCDVSGVTECNTYCLHPCDRI